MAAAINVPLSFCQKKRLLCRLPINLNISFVFREFCLSSMQYKETLIFLWQEQARRTSAWTRPSFSSYNDRAPGGNVHYVIMHYSPYELRKTFYVHEIRCCECLLFVPSHKCFHILEMSSSHTGEHANNNILNPGAERSAKIALHFTERPLTTVVTRLFLSLGATRSFHSVMNDSWSALP